MAISAYEEPSPYQDDSERTTPAKRIRWATQRVTGRKGTLKRKNIFNRHAARQSAEEKKRESTGTDPELAMVGQDAAQGGGESEANGRTIYFNQPLPAHARDNDGRPLQHYKRNKVRTAKYTPVSFVPKNLWFQFHNIANVYFLFIIILGVRPGLQKKSMSRADPCAPFSVSPSSALRTQA